MFKLSLYEARKMQHTLHTSKRLLISREERFRENSCGADNNLSDNFAYACHILRLYIRMYELLFKMKWTVGTYCVELGHEVWMLNTSPADQFSKNEVLGQFVPKFMRLLSTIKCSICICFRTWIGCQSFSNVPNTSPQSTHNQVLFDKVYTTLESCCC